MLFCFVLFCFVRVIITGFLWGKVFDSPSYCISRTGVGQSWHEKFFRPFHVLYTGSRTVISSTFMSENNQLMCNLIETDFWCYQINFCCRRKIIRFWIVMWNFNWMNPEVRYIQLRVLLVVIVIFDRRG